MVLSAVFGTLGKRLLEKGVQEQRQGHRSPQRSGTSVEGLHQIADHDTFRTIRPVSVTFIGG